MSEEKTVFDVSGELNPGVWFTLEGGGRVSLRVCSGEVLRSIRRKTMVKKIEYRNKERYEYEEFVPGGEEQQMFMMWDYSIVDWELFFDANGNPIPCTFETKKLLMGNSLKFSSFVNDKLLELLNVEKEKVQVEEKNL